MPLYVNVYQSLSDDGVPVPLGDATVCYSVEEAIEERDKPNPLYRYLYTVELPASLPRPNETADLDAILREQGAERELEARHEQGLRNWQIGRVA